MTSLTLKDIAELAGVSHNTVSCVLRGTGRISEETRDRVLKVVNESGYRPNASARAVRTGLHNCIALLQDNDGYRSSLEMPFIKGIMNATKKRNFTLNLASLSDKDIEEQKSIPRMFSENLCDGIILNFHTSLPGSMEAQLSDTPHVFVNRQQEFNAVFPDEFGASYQLTEHFLKQGFEQVFFIDLYYHHFHSPIRHYSRTDRYAGYLAAMKTLKKKPHAILDDQPNFTLEPQEIFELLPEHCAVITSRQDMSDRLFTLSKYFNRQVGQDIAFGTFGNQGMSTQIGYTKMIQDWASVAEISIEMLVKRMKNTAKQIPSQAVPSILT